MALTAWDAVSYADQHAADVVRVSTFLHAENGIWKYPFS